MHEQWQTIFERVNWQDGQAGGTPVNATNLNKGDAATHTLDQRVVNLNNRLKSQESIVQKYPEEDYEYEEITEDEFDTLSPLFDIFFRDGGDVSPESITYNEYPGIILRVPARYDFRYSDYAIATITWADSDWPEWIDFKSFLETQDAIFKSVVENAFHGSTVITYNDFDYIYIRNIFGDDGILWILHMEHASNITTMAHFSSRVTIPDYHPVQIRDTNYKWYNVESLGDNQYAPIGVTPDDELFYFGKSPFAAIEIDGERVAINRDGRGWWESPMSGLCICDALISSGEGEPLRFEIVCGVLSDHELSAANLFSDISSTSQFIPNNIRIGIGDMERITNIYPSYSNVIPTMLPFRLPNDGDVYSYPDAGSDLGKAWGAWAQYTEDGLYYTIADFRIGTSIDSCKFDVSNRMYNTFEELLGYIGGDEDVQLSHGDDVELVEVIDVSGTNLFYSSDTICVFSTSDPSKIWVDKILFVQPCYSPYGGK